ncbi:MAG TPA: DinB family protein [Puia sp.]|nr:DinB family protein [Puia sp.]
MLNHIMADFYEQDLRKLIEEINLFKNEDDLWRIQGSVTNSSGNLALHIIGGLSFLIGTTLANTGYVRDRDQEFTRKGVARKDLVAQLEAVIPIVRETVNGLSPEDLEAGYPRFFDKPGTTKGYVLMRLLVHLGYHLGQVNYLRRVLE